MFKWEIETSAMTTSKPNAIWKLWTQVSSWPTWSADLEWANLDGLFTIGSSGSLKPKGWPVSKFQLSHVDVDRRFETVSKLPFTQLIFDHKILEENGKFRLSYHVTVSGLLAPPLYFTMRPMLKKGLPENLKRFAEMTEKS